jgi:hypothetical protein
VFRNPLVFLVLGSLGVLPGCSQTREPVAIAIDSEGFEMRGRFSRRARPDRVQRFCSSPATRGIPTTSWGWGPDSRRRGSTS